MSSSKKPVAPAVVPRLASSGRPLAAHVQAAIQAKLAQSPPPRPAAPHVQAAVQAKPQPARTVSPPTARQTAPHVQAAVQAKLHPPATIHPPSRPSQRPAAPPAPSAVQLRPQPAPVAPAKLPGVVQPAGFGDLPAHLLQHIFSFLGPADRARTARVDQRVRPLAEQRLHLPGGNLRIIEVEEKGLLFYRLDPRYAREAYIYERAVGFSEKHNLYYIKDQMLLQQIDTFLKKGLPVYRGVPRWHATWPDLLAGKPIRSLGAGRVPDFNTHQTIFIPFSADLDTAKKAAISRTGMGGEKDDIRFVYGYNQKDDFSVGLVVGTTLTKHMPAGFFNASEVQVGGPVTSYRIVEKFQMGTKLGSIFGKQHSQATKKLSTYYDAPPTPEQSLAYIDKFGELLHKPKGAPSGRALAQDAIFRPLIHELLAPLPSDVATFGRTGASIRNEDL